MNLLQRRFYIYSGICIALIAVMFVVHLGTGFTGLSYGDIARILLGGGTPEERLTLFDFRMVRSVLAILIGAGLALAGLVFQTISRNELASPGLLGVNAGAGFAILLLVYFSDAAGASLWVQPIVATIGAGLAAIFIYRMSYEKGQNLATYRLVLMGISLTAGLHAVEMMLIVRLSQDKFSQVNTWIIGSIFGGTWAHAALLMMIVLVIALFFYVRQSGLDVLALSDETAIGLGVPLNRARFVYLMAAVALAASCVAIGGSIGFVGLLCPHIARRLVGVQHARCIPMTLLIGALLVLSADWAARVVIAPDEMLLGIVIALIGAPYFLFVLARAKA